MKHVVLVLSTLLALALLDCGSATQVAFAATSPAPVSIEPGGGCPSCDETLAVRPTCSTCVVTHPERTFALRPTCGTCGVTHPGVIAEHPSLSGMMIPLRDERV